MVADAPDPLDVLQKLLGSDGNGAPGLAKPEANGGGAGEEDFELELDFEDLSLREFVSRVSPYAKKEPTYTTQTVEECTSLRSILAEIYLFT
jgi:vacuolar protein sorting-associated protein 52